MKQLFCDCKTDEEKANFFLSGRAVETGIIAPAISNDVSMAYHRCAEFQKEIDTLRAKIAEMERQVPICRAEDLKHAESLLPTLGLKPENPLYALPGAQPAPSVPDGWKEAAIAWEVCASIHREYGKGKDPFFNTRQGDFVKHANDARTMLAGAPEAKP